MKLRNVIITSIIVSILMLTISNISFAKIDPNSYKPTDIKTSEITPVTNIGQRLISSITIVATVISVVCVAGLGIKYMMGSVEERADYKKSMVPMLVGMAFVFGISWIINIIYTIVSSVE